MLFSGDEQANFFIPHAGSEENWELKQIHYKGDLLQKPQLSLTVFTWSGSSKERDGKKLKFLMNWRWQGAFSPLISSRKNKSQS